MSPGRGWSQNKNESGIEAIPCAQTTIQTLALAAMELGPAMGANVHKTRPGMEAGIFLAVNGRTHPPGFTPEALIVTGTAQVDHLMFKRVIHVLGEMGVIHTRQGDNSLAGVACAGDPHSR